ALTELRAAHRQRHGEARANENAGIDGSQRDVELMAAGDEGFGKLGPVKHIGGEEPAEEHDLRDQKDPHPQGRRFALLPVAVEVMSLALLVRRALLSVRLFVRRAGSYFDCRGINHAGPHAWAAAARSGPPSIRGTRRRPT